MIFNFISKSVGRVARLATVGIAALALASCGGGGGSGGTPKGGNGGSATASSLSLQFSANQINSTATTPITVTVTALDSNNIAVPNVTIQFAVDSGVITPASTPSVTDLTGKVTATLGVGTNTTPRTINVTVTGGGATKTGTVQVVGTTTSTPTMSLLFSTQSVPSAGTTAGAVTVSALVQDSNNNALSGVPVAFTASSGILAVTSGTSNTSGLATATLNTAGNPTNRTITVTATGGGATTSSTIQVTGTTLTASGAPIALTLAKPQKFTFTLQDSAGNAISGAPVTFKSASGNTVVADPSDSGTSSAPTTNSNGVVILDVTPTVAGSDTLSVSADGATSNASFNVTNQSLSVLLTDTGNGAVVSATPQPQNEYANSSCVAVNASYSVNGASAAGSASVSTSLGNLYMDNTCSTTPYNPVTAPVSFAANGQLPTIYLRATTIGTAVVTVSESTGGVAGPTQSASVSFIAQLTPAYTPSITLTASPNLIAPNSPTSPNTNSSSIIATVRDGSPQNNPVQGVPVAFNRQTDPSGGSISPQVVLTQANGQAIATYYPGSSATAANGVDIRAQVQGAIPTAPQDVLLTVSGSPLFVTLGTGNTVNVVGDTSFSQDWSVYVTDSNGNPVSNVSVSGQLLPLYYSKGALVQDFTQTPPQWVINKSLAPKDGYNYPAITKGGIWCSNTDLNYDGIFDNGDIPIYLPGSTKTWNQVEPGIPGNVTVTAGTSTDKNGLPITNASGYAGFTVQYPQDHALWTIVKLTVNASTTGSQSTGSASFTLVGAETAYSATVANPPGQNSPYGGNDCGTAF